MQAEGERGDHAEVSAATAQRPEQVGVLRFGRRHHAPVGQHDLGLQQVVDGQAVLAGQVAVAAAQGEPADAGGGDDAGRRRQTVSVGRAVHLRPCRAALDAGDAPVGVHVDAVHRRQVDDEAALDGTETGTVVAAPADGDREVRRPRELEGARDVGWSDPQRTITAGRLSIMALCSARASSYPGVVGQDHLGRPTRPRSSSVAVVRAHAAHLLLASWVLMPRRYEAAKSHVMTTTKHFRGTQR